MKARRWSLLAIVLIFGWLMDCLPPRAIPPQPAQEETPRIVLVHWNDFHSANLPYSRSGSAADPVMVGGYANLAGHVDSLRRLHPGALVLVAGDDFQGSPVSSITRGLSQILILNQIRPTAFVVGNHEFDYGRESLKNHLNRANFPVLCANLYDSSREELFLSPYQLLEAKSVRIAVIGVIMKGLRQTVLPANVAGLGVLDPLTEIRRQVALVRDQSDIIVLLSHCGFEEDSLLATQLDEVDVIIGGHSHSILSRPRQVNGIWICQAGSRGAFVGCLRAQVERESKTVTAVEYELIPTIYRPKSVSAAVAQVVDSLETLINAEMNQVIAELKSDWRRNSRGESNIGNWIADAMRNHFKTDIAFQNSGGIRKNLAAGPVYLRDMWEIMPFENTVDIFEVNGRQLEQLLKWRISHPRDLLQVSGLRITYDYSRRVLIDARVNGEPIEQERRYSIAINNYIAGHSGRFFGLSPVDVTIRSTPVLVRDILIETARNQRIITSAVEQRLIDISGAPAEGDEE